MKTYEIVPVHDRGIEARFLGVYTMYTGAHVKRIRVSKVLKVDMSVGISEYEYRFWLEARVHLDIMGEPEFILVDPYTKLVPFFPASGYPLRIRDVRDVRELPDATVRLLGASRAHRNDHLSRKVPEIIDFLKRVQFEPRAKTGLPFAFID